MTGKRFRIYQDIYEVFYIEDIHHYSDKRLQKGYKIGHEEDVKYEDVLKVVDLLNALHEENQKLLTLSNMKKGALVEENGEVVIYPEKCDDCDLCLTNCPNQAISKV